MNPTILLLLLSVAVSGGVGWTLRGLSCELAQAQVAEQARNQAEQNRMLRQANINVVDTQAAKRRKKERAAHAALERKLNDYENRAPVLLPPEFRVLHDDAAIGEARDTGGTDVAPVAAATVARTVADNYADARSNAATLEALQAVVQASGCFALP